MSTTSKAWGWIKGLVSDNKKKVAAAVITAVAWGAQALGADIPEPLLEYGTAGVVALLTLLVGAEKAARDEAKRVTEEEAQRQLAAALTQLQEQAERTQSAAERWQKTPFPIPPTPPKD